MSKFKTFNINYIRYCFEFLILDFGPEASGCNLSFGALFAEFLIYRRTLIRKLIIKKVYFFTDQPFLYLHKGKHKVPEIVIKKACLSLRKKISKKLSCKSRSC